MHLDTTFQEAIVVSMNRKNFRDRTGNGRITNNTVIPPNTEIMSSSNA